MHFDVTNAPHLAYEAMHIRWMLLTPQPMHSSFVFDVVSAIRVRCVFSTDVRHGRGAVRLEPPRSDLVSVRPQAL